MYVALNKRHIYFIPVTIDFTQGKNDILLIYLNLCATINIFVLKLQTLTTKKNQNKNNNEFPY